jgi:ribonuclease P protein component
VAKQFALGKKDRLKSRKRIDQLFSEGKSFSITPFRIYYLINFYTVPHSPSNLQFGAGVSGKNFKKAVDRNRIKRLIKESYRLQKSELQQTLKEKSIQLNIFFIYTDKELPDFDTVKVKVNVALKKLRQLVEEI